MSVLLIGASLRYLSAPPCRDSQAADPARVWSVPRGQTLGVGGDGVDEEKQEHDLSEPDQNDAALNTGQYNMTFVGAVWLQSATVLYLC